MSTQSTDISNNCISKFFLACCATAKKVGYVVFYICCLMWCFLTKKKRPPNFLSNPWDNKNNKMTVLSVDKIALECTRRPGTVWFVHCIFVISVVVGLIRVKKNVFIALVNILNKQKSKTIFPHIIIVTGPTSFGFFILF